MTALPAHPPSSTMLDTVRDRCRAMSMPTWRCDTAGVLTAEPSEPGLAGLWLRSSRLTDLVSRAAKEWSTQTSIQMRELFPGCWLVPIVHEQRRRRIALTLAMALSPGAAAAPEFADACTSAGLDQHAVNFALAKLLTFDEAAARRAAASLQWTVHDLSALAEHTEAVQGFTHELTQSYETIDFLYAIGRSMLDLRHPERFLSLLCDRLFETLPFGYFACQFVSQERIAGPLSGRLLSRGSLPSDTSHIAKAVRALSAASSSSPADGNTPQPPRGYLDNSTKGLARIVVQPITLPPPDGSLAAVLICGDKHGEDPQVSSYDMQLLEAAAGFTGAFLANARYVRDQQAMFLGTVRALTAAIDAKDRYTCGHSERVAHLAAMLAAAAGLEPTEVERIHIAGLVHDVGKIGVPEYVLCKPGRLTAEEFDLIKLHPEIGHRILKDIPMLEDVLPAVLHHHERFSGGGYPGGISGSEIPLSARLICIADTFDAMSSDRSYRPAMPRDKILEEIRRCSGSQFDPDLAARFIQLDLSSYDAMVKQHANQYGPQRVVPPLPLAAA